MLHESQNYQTKDRVSALTGIWHQSDTMTHHTHFVQTRLPIEQNKISVFQMTLHDPPVLKEGIGSLVVSQVYTFAGIPNDISRSRIRRWSIAYQFL